MHSIVALKNPENQILAQHLTLEHRKLLEVLENKQTQLMEQTKNIRH